MRTVIMAEIRKDSKVPLMMKNCVSKQIVKDWKPFGRILLEDPNDEPNEVDCLLDDIDIQYNSSFEKRYQMLQAWQERKGDQATPQALVKALRTEHHNSTADQVEKMISCSHKVRCLSPQSSLVEEPTTPPPSKPKLADKELIALNYKRKQLVSRSIGVHWRDLAEMLAYDCGNCDLFASQGEGADEHCRRMLDHWFKTETNTYEELADSLHQMGEALAGKLKKLNEQA